ncbi:MAG: hypothetical protein F6J86_35795 [Symploca sp. SIO1B1]|nr:hypothetical protein [Symploca sp. SIO1C2]NER99130.1 hypothetical protein [Symploca sp. SIO1B1]
MALFEIPKRYYPTLRDLIALNEQQASKLIEALQELPLSLNSKKSLATVLAKLKRIQLSHGEEIISFLSFLHYSLEKEDDKIIPQELAFDVAEAINNEKSLPSLNQVDKQNFSNRLVAFLQASSSLGIIAKGEKLFWDNERVYLESRILTDIRTVFQEFNEEPVGAVIVHNLRITYRQNDQEQELFMALDESSLVNLSQQIARARAKVKAIKNVIEKAEITHLSVD